MAAASSSSSVVFWGSTASRHSDRLFVGRLAPPSPYVVVPRAPFNCSTLVFSWRRRNSSSAVTSSTTEKMKKKNKKLILPENDDGEEEDIDEDAFEALFRQLEEDLKNDDLSVDDSDDEISEEDLAKLEQELEEALGDDELSGMFDSTTDATKNDMESEEEEEELKLKNWQLRRLASALKDGRRKTRIKSLAAELCLDRAVVLELLRDPPPNLLLMCASLPDKVVPTSLPETKPMDPSEGTEIDAAEPEPKVKMPVHVMQTRWSMQKRLKKVQIETLERVYSRTKRPTNAMISSIVHVTNLPRRRVLQWFEDKRAEDGVPDHRLPYQRSAADTVFTS